MREFQDRTTNHLRLVKPLSCFGGPFILCFLMILPVLAEPEEPLVLEDARTRLLNVADQYTGTPYRYGGVDLRGLDCSGLIYLCFRNALELSVPRTVAGLYAWTERVPESELQEGDLVFFKTSETISHVGIYAGDGRFIHAASRGPQTGVLYSALSESYWRRTYVGAGRALPVIQQ